jgi:hypothetical protein
MNKLLSILISVVLTIGLFSCSVGMDGANVGDKQRKKINTDSSKGQSKSRQSRNIRSGPTDINSLSNILERAGHPLTESQINYLLKLKTGPEFTQKMVEVLDDEQIEAVNNASKGRGGRRR